MNKVALVGRVCKEIELKYLGNGVPVANYTIAINRTFKNKDGEREADFINIVQFGKGAEITAQYVKKGSQIGVVGRIQTRNYENKEGQRVYITEVVADEVHFLDSKNKEVKQEPTQDLYPLEGDEESLPF